MPVTAAFIVPHPPVIVPEVGQGREAEISATTQSYQVVAERIAALQPDTIVLLSPHSTMYADYMHISPGKEATGSLARFGAPTPLRVDYDSGLVETLCALCERESFPAGTLGERDPSLDHGTLVPLHFIRQACQDFQMVRIAPSGLSPREHYRFGMLLRQAVELSGRRVVIVASGDLSHRLTAHGPYGFAPEGPELDRELTGIMETGDFSRLLTLSDSLREKGGECGVGCFQIMAGALDGMAVTPELLSYQGPLGVGYGVAAFTPGRPSDSRRFLDEFRTALAAAMKDIRRQEDPFVRLARETLEAHVTLGNVPPLPQGLPPELLEQRAGTFVSIKKQGRLRGCIGTIAPTETSIAAEIRQNAVSAGARDPRFPPVEASELPELVYSVDILSPPEPATMDTLDPQQYGVIVSSGSRRGLLLPMLEGIDTVEEQVAIARQKAGIGPKEPCRLERFRVVRHR